MGRALCLPAGCLTECLGGELPTRTLPACLPACLREIPSCGCMLFVGLCRSLLYILEMVNGNELMLGLLGLFFVVLG
jgi:hypothetical protein